MIALANVLVTTDFSEPSDVALKYGRALSSAFGASLHVLHVLEEIVTHAWMPEVYVASLPGIHDEMEKAAKERLSHLLDEAEREKLKARLVMRRGTPYLEIVEYASEHNIDLIVIGTHGRGGLAHMMMGSVAERVVRKAPCPVLTVRDHEHDFVKGE
jgi:nucleotide-binding universal stress UspA family protein